MKNVKLSCLVFLFLVGLTSASQAQCEPSFQFKLCKVGASLEIRLTPTVTGGTHSWALFELPTGSCNLNTTGTLVAQSISANATLTVPYVANRCYKVSHQLTTSGICQSSQVRLIGTVNFANALTVTGSQSLAACPDGTNMVTYCGTSTANSAYFNTSVPVVVSWERLTGVNTWVAASSTATLCTNTNGTYRAKGLNSPCGSPVYSNNVVLSGLSACRMIASPIVNDEPSKIAMPTKSDMGSISQNAPNPFNTITKVTYQLPEIVEDAQILISDIFGKAYKTIVLKDAKGEVVISSQDLPAGTFMYSLFANGKVLETHKMVVVKN